MTRFLFFALLIYTHGVSAQNLTIGEAYDFEVGDELCYIRNYEKYNIDNQYEDRDVEYEYILKKVLAKEFYDEGKAILYRLEIQRTGCDSNDCWNTIDTLYEYVENLDSSVSVLISQDKEYRQHAPYISETGEEVNTTFGPLKRFSKEFHLHLRLVDSTSYVFSRHWAQGLGLTHTWFGGDLPSDNEYQYGFYEVMYMVYYKKGDEIYGEEYVPYDRFKTKTHDIFDFDEGDEFLWRHTYSESPLTQFEFRRVLKRDESNTHIDYTFAQTNYYSDNSATDPDPHPTSITKTIHERYPKDIPIWIWWGIKKAEVTPGAFGSYSESANTETILNCPSEVVNMFTYIHTYANPVISLNEDYIKGVGLVSSYYYNSNYVSQYYTDVRTRSSGMLYYKKGRTRCGTMDTLVFLNNNDQYQTLPLQLYPNPVNETLYLQTDEQSYGKLHVQIINDLGKMEKKRTLKPGEQIDVSDLPPGLYLLQVQQNRRRATQSFFRE